MTPDTRTAHERIRATLAQSDFLSTRHGLVSTGDLLAYAPPPPPVTMPPPLPPMSYGEVVQ